jgi:isopenicillin-N N-acyltransferase-like protein
MQWDLRQQHSLVALTIDLPDGLRIAQITEAGIIGKIGFNSAGVGICLNAIRCKGLSFDRLPLHLALRVALSAPSADIADAWLKKSGVATAGHILIADTSGGISTEWTAIGMQQISGPVLTHSNHFLMPQDRSVKEVATADSWKRVERIKQLLSAGRMTGEEIDYVAAKRILEDEQGWPGAINRSVEDYSTTATLFSIVMDLKTGQAKIRVGRPTEAISSLTLSVK